eukprot:610248-Pelagomonas_calceolata.AAC.3
MQQQHAHRRENCNTNTMQQQHAHRRQKLQLRHTGTCTQASKTVQRHAHRCKTCNTKLQQERAHRSQNRVKINETSHHTVLQEWRQVTGEMLMHIRRASVVLLIWNHVQGHFIFTGLSLLGYAFCKGVPGPPHTWTAP